MSPLTFRVGRSCISHFSIKWLITVALGGTSWTWTFRRTSSFPRASIGWPCKSLICVQPQHQLFDHFYSSALSYLSLCHPWTHRSTWHAQTCVQNSICMPPDAFSSICCIHLFLLSACWLCVFVSMSTGSCDTLWAELKPVEASWLFIRPPDRFKAWFYRCEFACRLAGFLLALLLICCAVTHLIL